MITVAIFNSIVVFLAGLAKSKKSDYWLRLSFTLIFLFLSLRYNYGNDYKSYLEHFVDIQHFDIEGRFEPAWQLLCLLFKPIGFFAMTAFLAAFNCFVYYRFVKKYVPPVYYWLAVFLYVFNPYLMLVQSSAMRQSIAISIFLISIEYLYKKDIVRYFLCIGLASLFHQSALILLPLFLIFVIDWKVTNMKAAILFILFLLLLVFSNYLAPYLNVFIVKYFSKYELYQEGAAKLGSGIGVLYKMIFMAFFLYYAKFNKGKNVVLFKITIFHYYFIPLALIMASMGRVAMYMEPVEIAAIPIMLIGIKDSKFKSLIIAPYTLFVLYSFYIFFQSPVWRVAFGVYNTIFSAPKIF
jgi:transmembrane protein EpsG